jgi:uncharacterized protein DUF1998
VEFTHRGTTVCRYELRLYELGASGEVADIEVQCVRCEKTRRMSDAFSEEGKAELAHCRGRWPHLRMCAEEPCQAAQRAILLGASNSWFPMTLSALSIPSTTDKLSQLIAQNWAELEVCESAREVMLKRKLFRGLAAYTDAEIWEAVEHKKHGADQEQHHAGDLREPEWQVLSTPDPTLHSRDFSLRVVEPPQGFAPVVQKVVLAERLREVRSLIGFTRIESPGDATDLAEFPIEKRASLSRTAPRWVPTSEVRGEGMFVHVAEEAIQAWLLQVTSHDAAFFEAHRCWRTIRGLPPHEAYPTMRYVLLHSLAHALIRQFALECGYTTASIRERIYSRPPDGEHEPMAGVLLYTAAPDSEGTLGGLVSLGIPQTLGRHLDQALEAMELCASDPLCAEHHPYRDSLTLHGAACHACLFLPETSCERGNKYLDRSVLVPTLERNDLAFFKDGMASVPEGTIVPHMGKGQRAAKPPRQSHARRHASLHTEA